MNIGSKMDLLNISLDDVLSNCELNVEVVDEPDSDGAYSFPSVKGISELVIYIGNNSIVFNPEDNVNSWYKFMGDLLKICNDGILYYVEVDAIDFWRKTIINYEDYE